MMHLAFNDVKLLACLARQTDSQTDRQIHSCCAHINYADCVEPNDALPSTHTHRTYLSVFIRKSFSLLTFPNGFHVGCVCGSIQEFCVKFGPQRIITFFISFCAFIFKFYLYFLFWDNFWMGFFGI